MKLQQLIKSYDWLSVELTLIQLYPDQVERLDDYRAVFEKLRTIEPVFDDQMELMLVEYDSDPIDEGDEVATYVDVSGRLITPDPESHSNSYALEFTEWKKWLGMNLAKETEANFTELEIIAHCLFEMTFIDYEESSIQEEFKRIKGIADEYQSLSNDEKRKKTFTLEEIMNNKSSPNRKNIASDFLRLAASGQAKHAFEQYVSKDFKHHNPYFKGDGESLMHAMDADAQENPIKVFEILRILEDGDLVAVHSTVRQNPDAGVFVLVHFFRFEGDKIAEVWDIAQEVPAQMVNQFGMF